jgi:hypothetical protein
MKDYSDAERYCLERSTRLRLRSADSRWLIRLAVDHLPDESNGHGRDKERACRRRLAAVLRDNVRKRYGNPVVVWVLLNIVVPVVVRLVLEWWLHHKET